MASERNYRGWTEELVLASPLANTHDHTLADSFRFGEQHDFTYMFDGYAACVFLRTGMTRDELAVIQSKNASPEEKWDVIEPYWPHAKMTGVLRAQIHTVRDLFGFDDLDRSTVGPITDEVRRTNNPGRTVEILKDAANFHHCQIQSIHCRLFPETRIDDGPGFLLFDILANGIIDGREIATFEEMFGTTITSLDQYIEAVDWYFSKFAPSAVAIKSSNGYLRPLDYRRVDKPDAERAFQKMNSNRPTEEMQSPVETRAFEDYVFHHLCNLAEEYGLPMRLHAGYTAGVNMMAEGHITDLEPTIAAHPGTRFILLHTCYPFLDEAIGLAMAHGNVYADLGWIWQIDPVASEQFVERFITSVGPQQLLVFGGDTGFAEVSYGYSRVARYGIARAIASLLSSGYVEEHEVADLVRDLCVENARRIFRLEERFGM